MQKQSTLLATLAALALLFPLSIGSTQETGEQSEDGQPAAQAGDIEEVVVVGRLLSAAESLVDERIELPFSADFLGAEVITRAGDTNIAAALRRVPGLTLIDGKFVYVRGLGERYSSVTVNGAAVPSPELTRSVIPLDLFPTSIVESVKIQKSPSPDQPAAFGGGAIDIRTNSIPDGPVATVSIGTGFNNESDSAGLVYPGSGTPLPAAIRTAVDTYRGDISVSNILMTLRFSNQAATLADAQAVHQGLLNSLDTNVGSRYASLDPDFDAKMALGNAWDLSDQWRFGVLVNATYNEKNRNENQRREGVGDPEGNFVNIDKTVNEERTVGALNLGLGFRDDHRLDLSTYVLRNDEDEARISRGFDQNNEFPDQKVNYATRLEERELTVTQISGEHTFVETPFLTDLLERVNLSDLEFDWFFSDSEATTDIPNETDFQASALLNPDGRVISTQLLATTSSGKFSFLELQDEQTSWGGNLRLPLEIGRSIDLTVSGGWWGTKKGRDYRGYNVNLNSVGVLSDVLAGDPGDVLVPGNVTIENGFDLSMGSQFGTESYVAGQKVDAGYGMVDAYFNDKWRLTAGARYEVYQQAVLPIDLLDYSGVSVTNLQTQLSDPNQRLAIKEDDVFPSLAATYVGNSLFRSDEYQIRFSFGETIVRPDLREVADVVFIDPDLDLRVEGNPALRSSPINNFEIRSEFFYSSGDNFTVSLFYKDIESPIERVRSAGTDDDVILSFENAQSGEVYGVEFEGLKQLWGGLFVQGNLTLSDSEIVFASNLGTDLTNITRRMTGHSEWVANTTLGYDSANGRHSAYLNYNAFGDRIFFAGTGQNDDALEKPFHSLGIVYKYYPTERIEVSVKLDNILDEKREFEQTNFNGNTARIVDQQVGTNMSVSGKWSF